MLLFVGCIPLLVSTKALTEPHKALSINSDRMQSLIPECSAAHNLLNEDDSSQTAISSPTPGTRWFSKEESDALAKLLLAIVKAELSQCVLAIVWDSGFSGSVITDRLSLLPNIKQVIIMQKVFFNP